MPAKARNSVLLPEPLSPDSRVDVPRAQGEPRVLEQRLAGRQGQRQAA